MACGKGNGNQPIEDFIVHSPAPVDMAAKMSAIYNELSFKVGNYHDNDNDKDNDKDKPAPVDMAAKMSAIYNELSFKVRSSF